MGTDRNLHVLLGQRLCKNAGYIIINHSPLVNTYDPFYRR
jgi:hypothetical protein